MAVTLLGAVLSMILGEETMEKAMYLSQILMLVLIILVCFRIVDKLIVHRIRELNDAMTEVAKGDFETTVEVRGNDELSQLTESYNTMAQELKMNAFLSKDFARYVSHEFKTPLSVIRNYAEITQDDAEQPDTAENMEIIISEVERLTCLSKDILELCKLDSTTIIEKKERFSPAVQLRTVILDFQLLWVEKELEIIPELEEFEITSNEALLFRVWQNIIGNAIKFTERNGRISVSLTRADDSLVCKIADNGVGISDEEKEHIFTPFYSGNRFRNKDGSGLGLSLSQKIVEKLGGTISFESELGKGTTFTVTVPC
ncbi:MAG: ATP-binding protein [Ruminiclostridium sp.]